MTREERLARQEDDEGDSDETVYLGRGGRAGNGTNTYHDNRDCNFLQRAETVTETNRKGAQCRWLAPCTHCVLDDTGGE